MATQQEQKSAATAVAPAPVAAEEFAQVLKGNFKPRTERAATEVENAIQTLVTQALNRRRFEALSGRPASRGL